MNFIKSILTGGDGLLSSKRLVLFLIVFAFLVVVMVNLWDHTKILQADLQSQLYQFMCLCTGAVFGEPAMIALKSRLGPKDSAADPDPKQ